MASTFRPLLNSLQEQVQRILVQPLEAAAVFLAAGPRIFNATSADWWCHEALPLTSAAGRDDPP